MPKTLLRKATSFDVARLGGWLDTYLPTKWANKQCIWLAPHRGTAE